MVQPIKAKKIILAVQLVQKNVNAIKAVAPMESATKINVRMKPAARQMAKAANKV